MLTFNIYNNNYFVGTLAFNDNTQSYRLSYDDNWIQDGYPLSPHLLRESNSNTIKNYLSNIMPEGEALDFISMFHKIDKTNIPAILHLIGRDVSGAFSFQLEHKPKEDTSFRVITQEELLSKIGSEDGGIIFWDGKPRLSLAGIQSKLPVTILENEIGFGDGDLCSTHILKFETRGRHHLVQNEYICMQLAQHTRLSVPNTNLLYLQKNPILVVERFDRIQDNNRIKKLHTIDGCQALDIPNTQKYEQLYGSSRDVAHITGKANFKNLFAFIDGSYNTNDKEEAIEWVIYNLFIANADAHAKNISFFMDNNGYRLAPFYDLVNIAMYKNIDQNLAMKIGESYRLEEIKAYDLACFCEEVNITPMLFMDKLESMKDRILEAIDRFDNSVFQTEDERIFANILFENIRGNITTIAKASELLMDTYSSCIEESIPPIPTPSKWDMDR